jgi:hypothetical protein
MALEVESQKYLFFPEPDTFTSEKVRGPPFRMNFLHDIESVWWAFTWIFFYHTDTATANAGHSFDTQWEHFQMAFPGTLNHVLRHQFFTRLRELHERCQTVLSKTCYDVCQQIPDFARALLAGYKEAEANYPSLALNDTILERIHGRAAEILRDAGGRAGDIELCPLPSFRKQKRPRPGDETSPPSKIQGKKSRHD